VIITTRDAHVGLVLSGGRDPITVYPPTPTDAALLLRTSLAEEPDPDPDTVLQILNILDCLPLAITQACAYINRNKIMTTQYLALLTENDAGLRELLSDDQYDLRRGFDSINSVIRTWKISFDHIQNILMQQRFYQQWLFSIGRIFREICSEELLKLKSN
jgi:hypothetical protein